MVGDLAGGPDALARIVRIEPRTSLLRRTPDDTDPVERAVVANAEVLVVVTALADPVPRPRLIDRCLVAAYDGGLVPLLCLTKSDLARPDELLALYEPLGVEAVVTGPGDDDPGVEPLRARLADRTSVLFGQSGVGKSTLVNRLVPDADRAVGDVTGVGKGRHTSSSAVALPLPGGGTVVDTPGVRSFGLGAVTADAGAGRLPRPGRGRRAVPARLRPPARAPPAARWTRWAAERAREPRPGWTRCAACSRPCPASERLSGLTQAVRRRAADRVSSSAADSSRPRPADQAVVAARAGEGQRGRAARRLRRPAGPRAAAARGGGARCAAAAAGAPRPGGGAHGRAGRAGPARGAGAAAGGDRRPRPAGGRRGLRRRHGAATAVTALAAAPPCAEAARWWSAGRRRTSAASDAVDGHRRGQARAPSTSV